MQSTTAPAASAAFTLNLHQRKRLLHAEAELIELYVLARDGKTIPAAELHESLDAICKSIAPAAQVARVGQLPEHCTQAPPADVQRTATPMAAPIAADTLASLFIVDAALRRLSGCLDRSPPITRFSTALPHAVLHLVVQDLTERMANVTHAVLASQEPQA